MPILPGMRLPARLLTFETTGKTLHALPTDTVLRTDADFDAFEHEVLGDD